MIKVVISVVGFASMAVILVVESARMVREPNIGSAVFIVTAIFFMALAALAPLCDEPS